MISTSEKSHFLSTSEQQLLLLCHDKNYISFNSQFIYKNQRSFNISISRLVKGGLMIKNKKLSSDLSGFSDIYELSLDGSILAKILGGFTNGKK